MLNARINKEKAIRDTKITIILDAAREVFSQKGFDSTRIEDIAYLAGFSKASLYNYYSDKEDIFISLAVREYNRLNEHIKTETNPDLSLRENLKAILKILFSAFGDHFAIFLTISNFMALKIIHFPLSDKKDDERFDQFKCVFNEMTKNIEEIINSARKKGEIGSSLNNNILAKSFGSLIKGVMFEWKLSGKMSNVNTAIYEILSFTEKGFGMSDVSE